MEKESTEKKDWVSYIQSFFMNKNHLTLFALFIAGLLNVFAYAPYHYWAVAPITLTLLLTLLAYATSPKDGAKMGFVYAFGWFASGISWVHVAIADFGGFPAIISVALMTLLDSYLALFPALACYLALRYFRSRLLLAFVPLWLVCEFLRGWLLTGFPWLSLGYTQTQGPLSGFAPIIGEFGLQALIVAASALISHVIIQFKASKPPPRPMVFAIVSGFSALFLTALWLQNQTWHTPTGRDVTVSLIQGNIEQSIKWQPENEQPTMERYLSLSKPTLGASDIVIWPEAAIPRLEVLANDFLRDLDNIAAMTNTAIITGIVDYQPETNLAFNNMIVLGHKNQGDDFGHYKYLHNNRFSKHHLLPIGEFVPFESVLRKLGPLFDLPMSSFSRGAYQQDNLIANGINISPAICFEVAFSDQVRSNLYQGENESHFILTLSNDAWFGDSHGPWQHLQIAQMRALEFAKPVIRVTNNGVTAVIDEFGAVTEQLPQFEESTLTTQLALSRSETFYYRFGNLPVWIFIVLTLIFAIKKPVRQVTGQ